jgi:hypothetical protein
MLAQPNGFDLEILSSGSKSESKRRAMSVPDMIRASDTKTFQNWGMYQLFHVGELNINNKSKADLSDLFAT